MSEKTPFETRPERPGAAGADPADAAGLQAFRQTQLQAWSDGTRDGYRRIFQAFQADCRARGVAALPCTEITLCRYLGGLVARGLSASWVYQNLAAIQTAHDLTPDPARPGHALELPRGSELKRFLKGLGKTREIHVPKRAPPLHREDLIRVVQAAFWRRFHGGRHWRWESEDDAKFRAFRAMAIMLVMRDGLLRASEAAELQWHQLRVRPEDEGWGTLQDVVRKKVRRVQTIPVSPDSLWFLTMWRAVTAHRAERVQGYEARLEPHDPIFGFRGKYPARSIARELKRAFRDAGLQGLSSHSVRRGAAQDMGRDRMGLGEIMNEGAWKSVRTLAVYLESDTALRGATRAYWDRHGSIRAALGPRSPEGLDWPAQPVRAGPEVDWPR